MRFRPEQHLSRQSDIRVVREQGRRVDCRAFTLWWKRRDTPLAGAIPDTPRVCVVASTAAVGNAVRRNRAKRRLREIFRQHQQSVPAGCDLMLIARAAAQHTPLRDLGRRFTDACGLIPPPASASPVSRPPA
jgi:ribonuclease P protein component